MKSTLPTLLLFLFAITLFYNCSPVPITRVNIAKEDIGYWQKGEAIGEKHVDSIFVEAAYSHSDDKFDYFDVAIENMTEERVVIGSKDFSLVDLGSNSSFNGVDPELMILKLEMKASKRDANNKTLAVVTGAVVVAGAIAVAASASDSGGGGSSSSEEHYSDDDNTFVYVNSSANGGQVIADNFAYAPILSSNSRYFPSHENIDFWKEYTLRKTTVFPDQRIRGLVGFLKHKYRKVARLEVPIKGEIIDFQFTFNSHKP